MSNMAKPANLKDDNINQLEKINQQSSAKKRDNKICELS